MNKEEIKKGFDEWSMGFSHGENGEEYAWFAATEKAQGKIIKLEKQIKDYEEILKTIGKGFDVFSCCCRAETFDNCDCPQITANEVLEKYK